MVLKDSCAELHQMWPKYRIIIGASDFLILHNTLMRFKINATDGRLLSKLEAKFWTIRRYKITGGAKYLNEFFVRDVGPKH